MHGSGEKLHTEVDNRLRRPLPHPRAWNVTPEGTRSVSACFQTRIARKPPPSRLSSSMPDETLVQDRLRIPSSLRSSVFLLFLSFFLFLSFSLFLYFCLSLSLFLSFSLFLYFCLSLSLSFFISFCLSFSLFSSSFRFFLGLV